MNDRIKELIKEMGIIPEDEHYEVAELIVMECADIAKKEQEYNDSHSIHVNIDYCIKHHFGVE